MSEWNTSNLGGATARQPVDLCGITIFVQQFSFDSYVNLHFFFYPSNEQKSRTERNDSCDIKHRPHKFNKTEGKFTRSTKSSQPISSMRPLLRKKSWVAYSHVKNTFKLVTLYMCVYTYVYMYIFFWWFYFWVTSTPNMGLGLTILRSTVTCSTDQGS